MTLAHGYLIELKYPKRDEDASEVPRLGDGAMPSDGTMTSAAAAELARRIRLGEDSALGPAYEQRFLDVMRERRIEETLTPRCSTMAACSAAKTPAPLIPPSPRRRVPGGTLGRRGGGVFREER